jgi:hypothetical protein
MQQRFLAAQKTVMGMSHRTMDTFTSGAPASGQMSEPFRVLPDLKVRRAIRAIQGRRVLSVRQDHKDRPATLVSKALKESRAFKVNLELKVHKAYQAHLVRQVLKATRVTPVTPDRRVLLGLTVALSAIRCQVRKFLTMEREM